ncbi:MAG: hypothetical protein J5852_00800 [Clostridia bacterium]|nr:hypothetical protein [Clostridia bacterium]
MKGTGKIRLFETVLFALLGAFMFASKLALEFLPNVHMIGMLTVLYTLLFRAKALFPVYVFVFLEGIYAGFNIWWVPYLYIWTILWGAAMLIPENLKPLPRTALLVAVCSLHGFLYGTLYAPFQALAFGLDFKGMIAWIIAGLPYDAIHGVGNLAMGLLIYPLYKPMKKAIDKFYCR